MTKPFAGDIHPAADMMPMLPASELRALAQDIARNGLRNPLIVDQRGRLLDGRNRLAACELADIEPEFHVVDVADPVQFVLSENLHRRHLTVGQRAVLALAVEAEYAVEAAERQRTGKKIADDLPTILSEGSPADRESAARAAALVGVAAPSVRTAKKLQEEPDLLDKVRNGELELHRAARIQRDRAAERRRIEDAQHDLANQPDTVTCDIRLGDFRTVLADLDNVDAIITDPPYPKQYLELLPHLRDFADRVLSPDGVLVILMGQTYLPDVYRLLHGGRPYRWTGCYLTSGRSYVSHSARVSSNWKPLIVYGGGPRFPDVVRAQGADADAKNHHEWGQDYGAFHTIVERFTRPGQTIVDPFAGSGTTLLAARSLQRHAIGAELDPQHYQTASRRLA